MISPTVLEVEHLEKSFGALKASDDISIDLRVGEIHALIGPNGAGKSTLIAQIAGTLVPDAGLINFAGRQVTECGVVERARMGLGRTFQVSALAMEFTVLQNTLLGALGARGGVYRFFRPVMRDRKLREAAMAALERVGMADLAATRAAELSHGFRRQLEVAVALAVQPKALLLDEPMAGLGAQGTGELIEFLDRERHQTPILLVEHDMEAVFALADRISVLEYGKIITTGTAAEIRRHPEVRRAYLGEGWEA